MTCCLPVHVLLTFVGQKGRLVACLLLMAFWLFGNHSLLAQTIRYVRQTATGTGNGSSWANASADLRAMLNASGTGDQVWVAAGIYRPGTDRASSFVLKDGVGLYGGFLGTETTLAQRPLFDNQWGIVSILSGEFGNPSSFSDNVANVVTSQNVGNTTRLDGFAITDGVGVSGGGMYNDHASPTITNCIFQSNVATLGAGMYNNASSPKLTNCIFLANTTSYYAENAGAGIYNTNLSSPLLINCRFQDNSAMYGGAMCQDNRSSSTLVNCSFLGNTSGGAIYNRNNSSAILANCVLFTNGDANTFRNETGGTLALSYCLTEPSVTGFINAGNNQTTTSSPFVSATNPRLKPSSPAIDAGNSALNSTPSDLVGNPRLVGVSIDLGAYEYQGPLQITSQFQSVTTVCGPDQPASFSVSLNQADQFTATLYRDQTPLAQITTNQPTIRFSQSSLQSGSYQIGITTAVSSVTTTLGPVTVNPLPTPYAVSGGGALCPASSGRTVTLAGSQVGVNYQLRRDGLTVSGQVAGTGSGLTFDSQTRSGQFTVLATVASTGCQQLMSGSATLQAVSGPLLTLAHTNVGTLGASTGTASVTVSGGTPTYSYAWSPGTPTGDGTSSISSLSAGTYGVTVTDANGCTATGSTTVGTDPDLTVVLYARPSTLTGSQPITVVVDVFEINGIPITGPITLKIAKDAKVTLNFDASLANVGGKPVQNSQWTYGGLSGGYYVLTSPAVQNGSRLSVGLSGTLSGGTSTGVLTVSGLVTGGGESQLDNNADADRIEYFQP